MTYITVRESEADGFQCSFEEVGCPRTFRRSEEWEKHVRLVHERMVYERGFNTPVKDPSGSQWPNRTYSLPTTSSHQRRFRPAETSSLSVSHHIAPFSTPVTPTRKTNHMSSHSAGRASDEKFQKWWLQFKNQFSGSKPTSALTSPTVRRSDYSPSASQSTVSNMTTPSFGSTTQRRSVSTTESLSIARSLLKNVSEESSDNEYLARSKAVINKRGSSPRPVLSDIGTITPLQRSSTPPRCPPSKRRRVCAKRSKHWETPRAVVVQAGDFEFRLEAGRLGRLSQWFNEALRGGEGSEREELGVIDLEGTGVSGEDFERLLDHIENFHESDDVAPSFNVISGIIRASTALRFEGPAAWATRRLHDILPTNLNDLNDHPVAHMQPHAIQIIKLARQCNIPGILKPAFYELVRGSWTLEEMMAEVLDVGNDSEKTTFHVRDVVGIGQVRDRLTKRWVDMAGKHDSFNRFGACGNTVSNQRKVELESSWGDLNRDLNVGLSVAERRAKFEPNEVAIIPPTTRSIGPSADSDSKEGTPCITTDSERLQAAHSKLVLDAGTLRKYLVDPIGGLRAMTEATWVNEGMCADCFRKRKIVWQAERERLWAEMNTWFGLKE
ncbi:hypothetical protein H0H93_004574 [Arthromyces matolae]|nr:hypothetical protein H0H93_004574 [Arthromyces matolae]